MYLKSKGDDILDKENQIRTSVKLCKDGWDIKAKKMSFNFKSSNQNFSKGE